MALLVSTLARANEAPAELHRNPFDRPAAAALTTNAAVPNTDSTTEGDPYLRAVLVAGLKSVVDFGGSFYRLERALTDTVCSRLKKARRHSAATEKRSCFPCTNNQAVKSCEQTESKRSAGRYPCVHGLAYRLDERRRQRSNRRIADLNDNARYRTCRSYGNVVAG